MRALWYRIRGIIEAWRRKPGPFSPFFFGTLPAEPGIPELTVGDFRLKRDREGKPLLADMSKLKPGDYYILLEGVAFLAESMKPEIDACLDWLEKEKP